ncbi:hypothetical protein TcCL_Unassigned05200 [Trypanosoma cruzi]|nr:hypothetical protein TcCL_Unassigned05200 [Trypanosoma cruzi]
MCGHPCLCCGNATALVSCGHMGCRAQPKNQRRQERSCSIPHLFTHTLSDEDMVDLHLVSGNLRIQSHPVRLLGNTFDRLLNSVTHASTAAKRTMPRRYQLRLVAEVGASHHTMRSFLIGCVHSVLFHNGEAIVP